MPKTKKKKKTRGKLTKELDAIFSVYIRLKKSQRGVCKCVTCGASLMWKDIQNGHFISRSNYNYRWDENNCFPQCKVCNVFKNGMYINYTLFMVDKYGRDKVEEMKNNKKPANISTVRIQDQIEYYKDEVQKLKDLYSID